MSSPQYTSSPPASNPLEGRRRSKFTFKHLNQLSTYSTTTPLRTIAHVDLDAFYAQCEMVRLGVARDQPLAVQQWGALIAINYPSRKFGLTRHITAAEAKKLCPNIVCQHVATWREGDDTWAYHDDAFKNMGTHKVSLDPYRRESKKILATIKESLPPPPLQRVEKAGIDEVFIDMSAQIHSILLERYPELARLPPYDDLTENLPWPSQSTINWEADALVDLEAEELESDDPDWDDICLSIGAEIIRHVRKGVWDALHYTCSGGVARNKMLAKLGSGFNKPNKQTVIRTRAIQKFLNDFKFTKIRNLGGKLGDEIVAAFGTDLVKELCDVPVEQLQKLGDDTGVWLYNTLRGIDSSEVNSRTQVKSMLSAKSFRPSINTFEQGVRWLRIFAADIFSRCVEEGVLENKRKPKTITLHHRQGGTTKSKQALIPQGGLISEELIFDLAKSLLAQIVVDGRAWPCSNLSLSAGGFEDTITGNMGIKGFLVTGGQRPTKEVVDSSEASDSEEEPPTAKRQKIDVDDGIRRFFAHPSEAATSTHNENQATQARFPTETDVLDGIYICKKCSKPILQSDAGEHEDWHFAKNLENELRQEPRPAPVHQVESHAKEKVKEKTKTKRTAGQGHQSTEKVEKGQQRLRFGNG
ncbi:DNA polymerase eta [Microthyrium microscopicum]|uniref:DNA polymerase eta n=1 Tax=Microthyrium microscopicum TaxID=703497 RepID=A0A6A6UNC1_9PEZI|nr:DNA polymerase eta [Microthyrium microscopicum]